MKVFISHSHKDIFIAESMCDKIEKAGIEVYLDTRKVQFGDRIDQSVTRNIEDANEVVILITQSALHSKWIPYEIGQARALKKRIVPVLHGVDKNEVLEVLQGIAGLDLNEFDKYVEQLKGRNKEEDGNASTTEPLPKTPHEPKPIGKTKNIKIRRGQVVRLPQSQPHEAERTSENIGWVPAMNPYLGRTGEVLEVDEDNSAKLDVDGGKYWYAFEWLELLKS